MATVLESLNSALHRALKDDPRVVLMGEDILDPYGGAFKVTRGLSSEYPDRVLSTPISEAGMVGLAAGMALRGLRPVVEIMFGDFLTLAADPLINSISKFRWMYDDQVRVPLVLRTPMGGRRGYGPTHSQSLEKLFLGVPGLRVLAPSTLGDPGRMLYWAILDQEDPVLFVENKLLYLAHLLTDQSSPDLAVRQAGSAAEAPTFVVSIYEAPEPALTIAAYGHMADLARQALERLAFEDEIFCELVVPTQLAPFRIDPVVESVRQTGRLLVCEEGGYTLGWGAEVVARCAEALGPRLKAVQRLAALDLPIPSSNVLERAVLPGLEELIQMAKKMV
ncbi:MAG TPA: transketolase C-terminal domain-containing protein [Anaerolineaceae bacterium]|nr:transketolase C-terminal domain-containing protein [Anaerolineaceae bacterium]